MFSWEAPTTKEVGDRFFTSHTKLAVLSSQYSTIPEGLQESIHHMNQKSVFTLNGKINLSWNNFLFLFICHN